MPFPLYWSQNDSPSMDIGARAYKILSTVPYSVAIGSRDHLVTGKAKGIAAEGAGITRGLGTGKDSRCAKRHRDSLESTRGSLRRSRAKLAGRLAWLIAAHGAMLDRYRKIVDSAG